MNDRPFGGTLAAVSLAMVLAGISESASAKKPLPPPPASSTPSFYFVDSSNPPKVIGKAVSLVHEGSGLALIAVVGPNGRTEEILVNVQKQIMSSFSNMSVAYFESADCSGTAYVAAVSSPPPFPGNGPLFALLQPNEYPVVTLGHSMLFVATQSTSQTINAQSVASTLTPGPSGDELDCNTFGTPYPIEAVPSEFFGNIYETYHQPFDVVYP